MQQEIGGALELTVGAFENWASTRYTSPLIVCEPTSLDQVKAVVKAAKKLQV